MSAGSWGQWTRKTQPSPCPVTLYLRDIGDAETLSGADPPQQCRGRAGGRQSASYVAVFAPFSLNDLSAARVGVSRSQLDLIHELTFRSSSDMSLNPRNWDPILHTHSS